MAEQSKPCSVLQLHNCNLDGVQIIEGIVKAQAPSALQFSRITSNHGERDGRHLFIGRSRKPMLQLSLRNRFSDCSRRRTQSESVHAAGTTTVAVRIRPSVTAGTHTSFGGTTVSIVTMHAAHTPVRWRTTPTPSAAPKTSAFKCVRPCLMNRSGTVTPTETDVFVAQHPSRSMSAAIAPMTRSGASRGARPNTVPSTALETTATRMTNPTSARPNRRRTGDTTVNAALMLHWVGSERSPAHHATTITPAVDPSIDTSLASVSNRPARARRG